MVSECYGVMVLWCHSAVVPWCYGAMVSWCHGAIVFGIMMKPPTFILGLQKLFIMMVGSIPSREPT